MSMVGATITCPLCLEKLPKSERSFGYLAYDIEQHMAARHKMIRLWASMCPGCGGSFWPHQLLQHYLDHIHDASHWIDAATRAALGEPADAH